MAGKTRAASSKIGTEMPDDLKSYLDYSFNQLLGRLATKEDVKTLLDEQQRKLDHREKAVMERDSRIEKIESKNEILKRQVGFLLSGQDEHEQYSRRLCLRIDGTELPLEGEDEANDECLDKVLNVFRNGCACPRYCNSGKATQQVIIRFTTWRHKTIVYRARKNAPKHIRFRLDLTKKRMELLIQANEMLKQHRNWFAFADVNCRARVKIGGKFSFFKSTEELHKLIFAAENDSEDL